MDLITRGDFAITNQGGKTTISFRVPSNTTIDFNTDDNLDANNNSVPGPKSAEQQSTTNFTGVSQNAPCPCGSGKKFKRCHGKV
ncbi:hypothetical protein GLV81_00050 [Phnomibacter ginsenosidimutans]|uniref:Preprotein translocase subunit SecA n=2 Tax=Phnomibacter ginsenosidimutans TaxID=2676868 RepID=A0A6I6GHK4_9BACT|nr:hypothetical protein GLV81_00050 [Phnomibacter ginsenosidimutans]